MTEEEPDRRLVAAILATGDDPAFRRLYDRHTPRLLRSAGYLGLAGQADREDAVQETWVRAVARLGTFAWRSSLAGWLGGILANVVRENRRAARNRPGWIGELDEIAEPWPDPPDATDRIALEAAVTALPPGGRAVLLLHDVEGYTHEEIAGFLGITPGTSKSQLCRARRAVVRHLASPERSSHVPS